MQLIQDGPDIPIDLANLIMSDKAVFFCGAGVSRNEGLPDFRQLAQAAVGLLGPHSSTIAMPHMTHSRYDAALQLVYDQVTGAKLPNLLKQEDLAKPWSVDNKIADVRATRPSWQQCFLGCLRQVV